MNVAARPTTVETHLVEPILEQKDARPLTTLPNPLGHYTDFGHVAIGVDVLSSATPPLMGTT